MNKIRMFLVGVQKEMQKVRWLTKKEMITYSIATVTIILIFAVFFQLSDYLIGSLKMLVK